ncbi:MAG: hypothetical protein LBK60_02245 [Verrucomicrobiales bacterium]|jgi:hypothetical protein|nr:hypothetical protein [Verrucomicrobiales bacterium]
MKPSFVHIFQSALTMMLGAAFIISVHAQNVPSLDPDGNGLYEAAERKALLDFLQAQYPSAKAEGVFDADGDGTVTLEEMIAGRHPLQQVIGADFLAQPAAVPWAVDVFPEWIMTAYTREDVAAGGVAVLPARGNFPIAGAQPDTALQPRKAADGGIEFAADSGQFIQMDGHRDARWSYRWLVMTFKIDGVTGSGGETVLLDINHPFKGDGPGRSSPKVWFDKAGGTVSVQYTGRGKQGLDRRVLSSKAVVADGKTWNVLVAGMRQGRMFAALNGVAMAADREQLPRYSSVMVGDKPVPADCASFIGDSRKTGSAWVLDALFLGQSELSEAMVKKLSGWGAHRLSVAARLPAGHPWREARPVVDAEDFPRRYFHDDAKWTEWLASNPKEVTRAHSGGPRVLPQGFERVFYDDFRTSRLTPSTSGEGDLWQAFGFNVAVGGSASLIEPGNAIDAYPYDAVNQWQILALAPQGKRFRGSAIYSVNDMGQGYVWAGPKVFRIRCKFPKIEEKAVPAGLFPAFWSYGTELLFWRTSNRIENDWWEFDGKGPRWMNGMSTHFHYPHVKNIHVKQNESYQRAKIFGASMTEEKTRIPGGIYVWDGEFHTWEFIVDRDWTYVNVSVEGADGETWYELWRCHTAPTYLEPQDLQLDYALSKTGAPPVGQRQDFIVDFVEVLQKSEDLARVSAPFTVRPALTVSGGVARCEANVAGVSDLRYYWFADGYPLTYNASAEHPLAPADAGKIIRCMVKAVGFRDQPEAWSDGVPAPR